MIDGIQIIEIQDNNKKSSYTREVLEKLPEWFGNEQALDEYVEKVKELPYYVALNIANKCIGFFSVKTHYQHTGEIFVCGVLPEYQHKGVGKALYHVVENYFIQKGCKYVIVKTLSDTVDFEPYAQTRKFYKSIGFESLITLTEMWDEENPCLIMLKALMSIDTFERQEQMFQLRAKVLQAEQEHIDGAETLSVSQARKRLRERVNDI